MDYWRCGIIRAAAATTKRTVGEVTIDPGVAMFTSGLSQ